MGRAKLFKHRLGKNTPSTSDTGSGMFFSSMGAALTATSITGSALTGGLAGIAVGVSVPVVVGAVALSKSAIEAISRKPLSNDKIIQALDDLKYCRDHDLIDALAESVALNYKHPKSNSSKSLRMNLASQYRISPYERIRKYLSAKNKSGKLYTNNGKRLFNLIVKLTSELRTNHANQVRNQPGI